MSVNFRSLSNNKPFDEATQPRRIFAALPSKSQKYGYPRDVQSEVWDQWHNRRSEPDLLIKMNTGSGKTVVGLLILKSALNERARPCAYVVADNYLRDQVTSDAHDLGLSVTNDTASPDFQSGRSILVANIHKLVNGRSVFGTSLVGKRIDIDTILFDDVHACISRVEEQFTLTIPRSHSAYDVLMKLFEYDLKAQSLERFRGILDHEPSYVLQVPFWAWSQKQDEVFDVLYPLRDSDEFRFNWPLISEHLGLCRVAVSSNQMQIAPPFPIIEAIPTIPSALRRVYMTATVPDNSLIVTHFSASPESISHPITPSTASDLGDRMILTPHATHPHGQEAEIHSLLIDFASQQNVVVIVPSRRRTQIWEELGAIVYDKNTINEGVEALKCGVVGLVVFVNKYDGIDLPGNACRILVIDGLPESYGELERLEELALNDTGAFLARQIQRIEQGMGRGIRSNEDWCVVLLLGRRLTERIYAGGALEMFSPATRAQLELSRSLAEQLREHPISELKNVISRCLDRDADWVAASHSVRDGVKYEDKQRVPEVAVALRQALGRATCGQFQEAADLINGVTSGTSSPKYSGWLKFQAAAYQHHSDPVQAQKLLLSAIRDNGTVSRPIQGVRYERLSAHADQAKMCMTFLKDRYGDSTTLVLGVAALVDDLIPDPESTDEFEEAWHQLGGHLGFMSQRPEQAQGTGPDVLWMLGDKRGLVVECKSGVVNDLISKSDASQLGHSIDWFMECYDSSSYTPTGLMIHKTNVLHRKATMRDGTRITTFSKLEKLRKNIVQFIQSISDDGIMQDSKAIGERLVHFKLTANLFVNTWTRSPKRHTAGRK